MKQSLEISALTIFPWAVHLLQTLAQDFVANQAFDYNAILRQKDKEIKQKGKNKSNEEGDQFGAWRTTPLQCIGSGEACYIGDTCCGGGQCPACNIGPCRCNES